MVDVTDGTSNTFICGERAVAKLSNFISMGRVWAASGSNNSYTFDANPPNQSYRRRPSTRPASAAIRAMTPPISAAAQQLASERAAILSGGRLRPVRQRHHRLAALYAQHFGELCPGQHLYRLYYRDDGYTVGDF
jgi:hypothetical protein